MEELPKVPCLFREQDRRWTLRRRVPDEIRSIFGKREVWRTYGASSFEEARRLHSLEMAKLDAVFAEARRRLAAGPAGTQTVAQPLPEPTEAVVRDAVRHWFHKKEREADSEDESLAAAGDAEEILDELRVDFSNLLDLEGRALAERLMGPLLGGYGFAPPAGELRRVAVGLIKAALVETNRRSQDRLEGRLTDRGYHPLFADITALGEPPAAPKPAPQSSRPEPLAPLTAEELLTAYAAERRPTPATRKTYTASFRQVSRILGFDDVRRITADDVVRFKTARLAEGKDPGTVADDVLAAGAVCNWAVKNRILPGNPFAGLAPKVNRRGPAPRVPYDDDEAARILTAARGESGWLRWLPWLLCFTGARIGELAELRRGDVRQEDGVWFLDVKPNTQREGKNATFQRLLPLHPAAIGEGFLGYVASLPADPAGPLFPSIPPDPRGSRITPATTRLGRWMRKRVGITDPAKAPAHSWRHRMEDELRKVRALPEVQDAITGRHNPRNAGAGYGRGYRGMPGEVLRDLAKVPSPLPLLH